VSRSCKKKQPKNKATYFFFNNLRKTWFKNILHFCQKLHKNVLEKYYFVAFLLENAFIFGNRMTQMANYLFVLKAEI